MASSPYPVISTMETNQFSFNSLQLTRSGWTHKLMLKYSDHYQDFPPKAACQNDARDFLTPPSLDPDQGT